MALVLSHEIRRAIQANSLSAKAMAQRAARLPSTKVIEVQAVSVRAEAPQTLYLKLSKQADTTLVTNLGAAESLVVILPHLDEQGRSRLSTDSTDTDVASDRVATIITDLALIEISPDGLVLKEVVPGLSAREIQSVTELPLFAASDLAEFAAEPAPATEAPSPHA